MIIDLILDREDGKPYYAKAFYDGVMEYGEYGHGIATALDSGKSSDVQDELCKYIRRKNYSERICDYIKSVRWIEE